MKQLSVSVITVSALAVLLSACSTVNTMPDKPGFKASSAYDGKYKGERIDTSGGSICRRTTIIGQVEDGEARFRLTYNGTNLKGWISESGELKLYNDSPRWDYQFTGTAANGEIQGNWSVGNAVCKGTWSVQRL